MSIINLVYEAPEGWKPGANTILYMPLKSDLLDHGPNNIQFTQRGTITLDSQGANFELGSIIAGNSPSIISGDFTFSSWINPTASGLGANILGIGDGYPGYGYRYGANTSGYIGFTLIHVRDYNYGVSFSTLYGNWHNLILVRNGTVNTLYLDNTQVATYNGTSTPNSTQIYIGGEDTLSNIEGHINEVIIENKARTAQERDDYYNLTKGNYGL